MNLSDKEKSIYISVFTTIIIFGLYCFKMYGMYELGLFDGAAGLKLAGKSIVILFVVMGLTNIVFQMLGSLISSKKVNGCRVDLADERDNFIELKGMQVAYAVFGGGLFFTMIALAMGWSVILVLNLIISCVIIGEIVGNFKKLHLYKKGF